MGPESGISISHGKYMRSLGARKAWAFTPLHQLFKNVILGKSLNLYICQKAYQ